jgi:uncharacterized membrane protein (DUF485 family)
MAGRDGSVGGVPLPRHAGRLKQGQTPREEFMASTSIHWSGIVADPRFQALHHKKQSFLTGLMIFSVVYYFLLPIGAAYFPALFNVRVWGPINVGLLFALSEFVVAWAVAFYYSRRANNEFDAMARELAVEFEKKGAV